MRKAKYLDANDFLGFVVVEHHAGETSSDSTIVESSRRR